MIREWSNFFCFYAWISFVYYILLHWINLVKFKTTLLSYFSFVIGKKLQYYSLNGNKPGRDNMIGYNSSESNKDNIHPRCWISARFGKAANLGLPPPPPFPFPPQLWAIVAQSDSIKLAWNSTRPGHDFKLRKYLSLKLDSIYLEFYLTQCFDDLHM